MLTTKENFEYPAIREPKFSLWTWVQCFFDLVLPLIYGVVLIWSKWYLTGCFWIVVSSCVFYNLMPLKFYRRKSFFLVLMFLRVCILLCIAVSLVFETVILVTATNKNYLSNKYFIIQLRSLISLIILSLLFVTYISGIITHVKQTLTVREYVVFYCSGLPNVTL